mmetsp:Transcript_16025/g.18736  ORF Transcript_16025/g.18736 Transcript_16025/m.18736 type:complete len:98 (-) Transcript_16025:24-317(-)
MLRQKHKIWHNPTPMSQKFACSEIGFHTGTTDTESGLQNYFFDCWNLDCLGVRLNVWVVPDFKNLCKIPKTGLALASGVCDLVYIIQQMSCFQSMEC